MNLRSSFLTAVLLVALPAFAQSKEQRKEAERLLKRGILLLPHAPQQPVEVKWNEGIHFLFCLDARGVLFSISVVGKSSFANHDSLLVTCNNTDITVKTGYL